MQNVLSWRRNQEIQESLNESMISRRDISVPVSRKGDYSLNQDLQHNERYMSNTRSKGNYHKFKQSSKLFQHPTVSIKHNLQKSHPADISSLKYKKFSNDAMSEIRSIQHHQYRLGKSSQVSQPPFPIKTKRIELQRHF